MSDINIQQKITENINESDVVLFMKGTPTFPQCGFSATVVQVLRHLGINFSSHDVLAEPELRNEIKKYSNWPTIPQLYVKGEFLGGCDIIKEMFESGELKDHFTKNGIESEDE